MMKRWLLSCRQMQDLVYRIEVRVGTRKEAKVVEFHERREEDEWLQRRLEIQDYLQLRSEIEAEDDGRQFPSIDISTRSKKRKF